MLTFHEPILNVNFIFIEFKLISAFMHCCCDCICQSGHWNSSLHEEGDRLSLKLEATTTKTSIEFPLGKQVVKVVAIEVSIVVYL